jgi:hypothetical protein
MTGGKLVPALPRKLVTELQATSVLASDLWRAVVLDRERPVPREFVARAEMLIESGALARLGRQLDQARAPASDDQILEQLAMLIAAFPNFSGDNPAFAHVLANDVAELSPSRLALGLALARLRRTQRFLPSIAETLAAIEAAEALIAAWARQLGELPANVDQAKQRIKKERPANKVIAAQVRELIKRASRKLD